MASLLALTCSEGNYESLRMLAFDCLLICKPPGRSTALATYLLDVIRSDSSLTVRRHVARCLSEAILFSLAVGEIATIGAMPSIVDVTLETEQTKEQRGEAQNAAIVKTLRKEFGKKLDLRKALQDALV